jgi:3',5'-cyclic AMP phosphodiesterase CpdA
MITRLLHLSDVHFGGENVGAAEAVIAFAIAEAADLILVTGDLTLNGLPREFEAAARWLQRLPTPRLVTPGNHDTPYWNLLLRALTPFARYQRYIGTAGGEDFDGPTVAARTINTARGAQPRPDWSKGAIDLEQCRLTVCDLAAGAPGALKVVACHHPLVEALDTPVTGGVHRGEEADPYRACAQPVRLAAEVRGRTYLRRGRGNAVDPHAGHAARLQLHHRGRRNDHRGGAGLDRLALQTLSHLGITEAAVGGAEP